MQANEAGKSPPLTEIFRARVRARAAELYLSHQDVAVRMRKVAHRLGVDLRISRRKVSTVVAGEIRPGLDELTIWALALETTEAYLLGFTFDPTPAPGSTAILGDTDTPGDVSLHLGALAPVLDLDGYRKEQPRAPIRSAR